MESFSAETHNSDRSSGEAIALDGTASISDILVPTSAPTASEDTHQASDVAAVEESKSITTHGLAPVRSTLPLPLVLLGLLAGVAGVGVGAFWGLLSLPPLPECEAAASLSGESDRLYCAEQAIRAGKPGALLSGLGLVKSWSSDSPLYVRAKALAAEWSEVVLTVSRLTAEQDKLDEAIALAKQIPTNVAVYREARQAIAAWEGLKNQAKTIEAEVIQALKQQYWGVAEAKMQALADLGGRANLQRSLQFKQRLKMEKIAYRQLQPIRKFVKAGRFDNLVANARVIQLAKQVPPDSYVRFHAEREVQRITQGVAKIINRRLVVADLAGATAIARAFPQSVVPPAIVRDLLWLDRAQPLTSLNLVNQSVSQRLFQLWAVLPQLRQIKPDSLLYTRVKVLAPQLEKQLQDLTQLHLAAAIAGHKQPATYQQAIQAAQAIAPGRPLRVYAQTLVASWRQDLQAVEDRPILNQAEQLAATATHSNLKAAIATAQKIAPKRALRPQAAAAIARWTRLAQMLEDLPLLQRAQSLAQQGDLQAATQLAQKIQPNRPLQPQARQAIQRWNGLIQLAVDRPILVQARALAAQGALGNAIKTAAQISPGRALSVEAQSAIAQWSAQIKAIQQVKIQRQLAATRLAKQAASPALPLLAESAPPAQTRAIQRRRNAATDPVSPLLKRRRAVTSKPSRAIATSTPRRLRRRQSTPVIPTSRRVRPTAPAPVPPPPPDLPPLQPAPAPPAPSAPPDLPPP